jgi:hypothetical protein
MQGLTDGEIAQGILKYESQIIEIENGIKMLN